jgi:hypothetical protein
VIEYLYHVDQPKVKPPLVIPTESFVKQVELFETAEYLGLDELKVRVLTDGVMKRPEFLKYTNVRRHYLDNIHDEALPLVSYLIFQLINRSSRACHRTC